MAPQGTTIQLRLGSFDCERSDIDAQDVEAALRHPNRIGSCPRADLQHLGRPNATRSDELDTSNGSGSPVSQGSSPEA